MRAPSFSRLGALVFLLFFVLAVFAGWIAPYDPWERFDPYLPPSTSHWLGTNDMGQDIFSELVYGTRVSLLVGFAAALLPTAAGVLIDLLTKERKYGYLTSLNVQVRKAMAEVLQRDMEDGK